MTEYPIVCPCCGRTIYICINETGGLYLRSFDIQTDSETIEFIQNAGIEFGTTKEGKEV